MILELGVVLPLEPWHDALLATAGAGATLAGLIIVAMSVNITEIIKAEAMPARAGAAIASLVQVVVITIAALMPGLTSLALGVVTLAVTVVAALFQVDASVRQVRQAGGKYRARVAQNLALSVVEVIPFIVGGILLCLSMPTGLFWLVGGSLFVFIAAIVNAWVLLVEIRR